jgi:hypothetical protein
MVALTQDYLLLREDQRYHFDRLLWVWKQAFLWTEADLGMSVRFLERVELDALLAGDLGRREAGDRISEREEAWKEEVERRRKGDEPSAFLVGAESLAPAASARRLQGMGISRGTVTGTVRVLRSVDEASRLEPGEILVHSPRIRDGHRCS